MMSFSKAPLKRFNDFKTENAPAPGAYNPQFATDVSVAAAQKTSNQSIAATATRSKSAVRTSSPLTPNRDSTVSVNITANQPTPVITKSTGPSPLVRVSTSKSKPLPAQLPSNRSLSPLPKNRTCTSTASYRAPMTAVHVDVQLKEAVLKKDKILELEKENQEMQTKLELNAKESTALEAQIQKFQYESKTWATEVERLTQAIEDLNKTNDHLLKQVDFFKMKAEDEKKSRNDVEKQLAEVMKSKDNSLLDEVGEEKSSIEIELKRLETANQALETDRLDLVKNVENLRRELDKKDDEIKWNVVQLQESEKKVKILEENIQDCHKLCQDQVDAAEAEKALRLEEAQNKINEYKAAAKELKSKLNQLEMRNSMLQQTFDTSVFEDAMSAEKESELKNTLKLTEGKVEELKTAVKAEKGISNRLAQELKERTSIVSALEDQKKEWAAKEKTLLMEIEQMKTLLNPQGLLNKEDNQIAQKEDVTQMDNFAIKRELLSLQTTILDEKLEAEKDLVLEHNETDDKEFSVIDVSSPLKPIENKLVVEELYKYNDGELRIADVSSSILNNNASSLMNLASNDVEELRKKVEDFRTSIHPQSSNPTLKDLASLTHLQISQLEEDSELKRRVISNLQGDKWVDGHPSNSNVQDGAASPSRKYGVLTLKTIDEEDEERSVVEVDTDDELL